MVLGCILTGLLSQACGSVAENELGRLRVQGQEIVNDQGPFLIKSIGTGNWMIQEGYMMQSTDTGIGAHTQFRTKLEQEIGEEQTTEFYQDWLDNHMTKADLDSMKTWGFNAIRPALHYKWFTLPIQDEPVSGQHTWVDAGFEKLDELMGWAAANQMYVMFDMHGAETLNNIFKMGENSAKTTGMSTMVVETHITYDRELKLDDVVDINLTYFDHDKKRLQYKMEMVHKNEKYLASTIEVLALYVDLNTRKVAEFEKEKVDLMSNFIEKNKSKFKTENLIFSSRLKK